MIGRAKLVVLVSTVALACGNGSADAMTITGAFANSSHGEPLQITNQPLVGPGGSVFPAVTLRGQVVGVYIDNEEPNRCEKARLERQVWPLVIVSYFGFPQQHVGQAPCHVPGVVNALEWYEPAVKPPPAQAYILQRNFHFPTDRPVPVWKQIRLYHWALRHKPQYVIWY